MKYFLLAFFWLHLIPLQAQVDREEAVYEFGHSYHPTDCGALRGERELFCGCEFTCTNHQVHSFIEEVYVPAIRYEECRDFDRCQARPLFYFD